MSSPEHARVLNVLRRLGEFCNRAVAVYENPAATANEREQIVGGILSMVGRQGDRELRIFPPIPPISAGPCDVQLSEGLEGLFADIERRGQPPV